MVKKYRQFRKDKLNESLEHYLDEEIVELAENELLEFGYVKNDNGRFDYLKDNGKKLSDFKYVIYNGVLMVSFGHIKSDFKLRCRFDMAQLPIHVEGELDLSYCRLKSLKGFNTKFDKGIDLSHNHLHEIENMPNKINGQFNVEDNMLTTFKNFPQEVESFNSKGNWCKDLINAPRKVNYKNISYDTKRHTDGDYHVNSVAIIDRKYHHPVLHNFYVKTVLNNPDNDDHNGINDYYVDFLDYLRRISKGDDKVFNELIAKFDWPEGSINNLKQSAVGVSKFDL